MNNSLLQYLLDNLWLLFLAVNLVWMLIALIATSWRGGKQSLAGKISETPGGAGMWFVGNVLIGSAMFALILVTAGNADWLNFLKALWNNQLQEFKRRAGLRAMLDLRDTFDLVILWIRYL